MQSHVCKQSRTPGWTKQAAVCDRRVPKCTFSSPRGLTHSLQCLSRCRYLKGHLPSIDKATFMAFITSSEGEHQAQFSCRPRQAVRPMDKEHCLGQVPRSSSALGLQPLISQREVPAKSFFLDTHTHLLRTDLFLKKNKQTKKKTTTTKNPCFCLWYFLSTSAHLIFFRLFWFMAPRLKIQHTETLSNIWNITLSQCRGALQG